MTKNGMLSKESRGKIHFVQWSKNCDLTTSELTEEFLHLEHSQTLFTILLRNTLVITNCSLTSTNKKEWKILQWQKDLLLIDFMASGRTVTAKVSGETLNKLRGAIQNK